MDVNRRGLTLVECLVSLVASSVILGGLLGLYSVADIAARSNTSDVYAASMDYNLDRVLTEVAASTSNSTFNPTRRAFPHPGPFGDNTPNANSPNQYLVYERPRRIVCTSYWSSAQGGPGPANLIPPAMPGYGNHPLPLFRNPGDDSTFRMVNLDLRQADATNYSFADNWLTGIIALHRRDPYDSDSDGVVDRFRTGILWQIEMPMPRLMDYGLLPGPNGGTFCPNGGTNGAAAAVPLPTIGGILTTDNPHLRFAGARILAVGVQTFKIDSSDPMTWQVTR